MSKNNTIPKKYKDIHICTKRIVDSKLTNIYNKNKQLVKDIKKGLEDMKNGNVEEYKGSL